MRDEAEKRRLDRQTPYLSLLPEMDEGMHIGYQEKAGIQCDGNQKPREWLENFARFLKTPGREVGYAIPDVLAIENETQWMLAHPAQGTAKRLAAWRGLLAALLLWDSWKKDSSWPVLTLEDFSETEDAFIRTVRGALTASP